MSLGLGLGLHIGTGSGWLGAYRKEGTLPAMIAAFDSDKYRIVAGLVPFTDLIVSERTGVKPAWLANGDIGWAGHNLVLNSAAVVTQNVTVISGAGYTVECTGAGSIALTNAGTGTASEGSSVTITATTTTLTLTVTGSVDTLWAYRSDYGGMQSNGDLPATPTYFPTTAAAYFAPAIAYSPVTLSREGIVVEGIDTTRLNIYPALDTTAGWAVSGATASNLALDALGGLDGVEVASAGATWHSLNESNQFSAVGGSVYYFNVLYRAGTSGRMFYGIRDVTNNKNTFTRGLAGSMATTQTDAGTISDLTEVLLADGVTYLAIGSFTATLTGDYYQFIGADSATSGETVIGLACVMGGADEKLPHTPIVAGAGSSVTVVKDVLTFDAGSEPFAGFDGTQGTWVFKGDWIYNAAATAYMLAGDAGTVFGQQLIATNTSVSAYDGTTTVSKSGVFTNNTATAVVMSYLETGNFNILADGSTETSAALTGDLATTTVDIGHLSGANGMHGVVSEILYYDTQLSLTTRQGFSA